MKTINDRQILESNGLVLHPCLDMLTDKNWKPEEEIPVHYKNLEFKRHKSTYNELNTFRVQMYPFNLIALYSL